MKQVALDIYRTRDRMSKVEHGLMGLLEEHHKNEMVVRDLEILTTQTRVCSTPASGDQKHRSENRSCS